MYSFLPSFICAFVDETVVVIVVNKRINCAKSGVASVDNKIQHSPIHMKALVLFVPIALQCPIYLWSEIRLFI